MSKQEYWAAMTCGHPVCIQTVERHILELCPACYDQSLAEAWISVQAANARASAAEARAERVEAAARALVEIAYSEEGDMGVRWYAVDADYVDALAKVLGIEQPGETSEEVAP